ncbi:MAG: molybdopterin dinucleotide binding domain-containing protein, partial [Gemmatimonadales bacterium]
LFDAAFVERWVNWQEYMKALHPDDPPTFDDFVKRLKQRYAEYTPEFAESESGVSAATIVEVARLVAGAGTALATHNWRAAAAGNLNGWLVSRTLFFLNVLTGSVGTRGGTAPNKTNKFVPQAHTSPPPLERWNDLSWPSEYPLAFFEMSFLLPHFLKEGRGKLSMYFTRVYNPVWTNPDGFSWIEVLSDERLVGCHAALTPVWSETAWLADYVLPVGLGSERHDLFSYETHASQWIGFRQPVMRAFRRNRGETITDTRDANPGEVWEENEFWIELSWRIDPDGSLGIRKHFESPARPGEKISVDEYYGWIFENSVPGLPEAAAEHGFTPLDYMRKFGAFEVAANVYETHEKKIVVVQSDALATDEITDVVRTPGGDVVGVRQGDEVVSGFATPSRRLELYSATLAAWGWEELAVPTYAKSHVALSEIDSAAGEFCLIPTFRIPIMIHTRTGNSKWLNEIAHTNPLWINRADAERLGLGNGDLVRVNTVTGYYVVRAWVTEGIRPGVVACSHHMGRWRTNDSERHGWATAKVSLERDGSRWKLSKQEGQRPRTTGDRDASLVWWHSTGVHQNLAFPVQPDPISGAHAWHQKVRVEKAWHGDAEGDVVVDTAKSHELYKEWLRKTRPAPGPDGLRRPRWLDRPLKPSEAAYRLDR